MIVRIIGLLFCLSMAVLANADPITLQQAEEQALKHNLALLAQRFDIDAAEADIVTAHLIPNNPNISVSGDITPDAG
ncbi:MAG TPA: TolC family protein, partial [Bacteroidota bacterium]|nr:TolC family protein [Bacteroidota bacterium]